MSKQSLVVVAEHGERIHFDLRPHGVVAHWDAFRPGSGYGSNPRPAELWLQDIARELTAAGELWVCLGRWHQLPAAAVDELRAWLSAGDEVQLVELGPRSRLSALALRAA